MQRFTAEPPGVQRGYLPFGREYRGRLPYSETFPITAADTGLSAIGYTFRNSLYDPRVQLGGHQPLQYDVISALYYTYTVHRIDYEVCFSNPDKDGMLVGLRTRSNLNGVATAGQTIDYLTEMGDSVLMPLNNTGSQMRIFKGTVPVARVLGVPDANMRTQFYQEDAAGNLPTYQALLEPFANYTVAGESATCRCTVKLVFHFIANNRVTAPQS